MNIFGLVGFPLSHSFSETFFSEKFFRENIKDCCYVNFPLENICDIVDLIKNTPDLSGLNVTIPYKQAIIPFLDGLSDEAQQIGAVNCVSFKNGKKIGYNTDAFGFEKTLLINKKDHHKKALILGDGGAAKAVRYILNKHNIEHQTISRKSEITFENLSEDLVKDSLLIIQTTPVGTFPNVDDSVQFPFEAITNQHYVIDLIYNPSETAFLKKSAEKGATTLNGFYMLEQQAERAWEIWKGSN